ncbi:MAG: HlyD family efflux transporter periplasmic adaptor subunit, partial [Rubrivivax sp.]
VPVAYTDTNEVWKLTRRRDRIAVAGAGVLTELALAAWATLAWALLPDGDARSGAFLLATTTWVATLAINLSPFMRFDGYFLLADALGLPNLHARSFALARWHLRERLFDLGEPPPEHFSPRRRAGLIVFAYATWAYRLAVFLGIAALVYTFFIKAVGVLLFAVEIGWFVLLPLARELRAWRELWPRLRTRPRTGWSALLLAGLVLALFLPWPSRPSAGALLRPAAQFVVYAPAGAQVQALPVAEGQDVSAGTPLLQLAAPDLGSRIAMAQARVQRLRWQATAGGLDPEQRAHWQTGQEQLMSAEAELASLQADAGRYAPLAPFSGQVRDVQPDLRVGDWLAAREPVLRVVARSGPTVIAYLDEDAIAHIAVGDTARFYADGGAGPIVQLEVAGIDADASRTLPEPELSTLFGGRLQARERNGQFHTDRPVYRVSFRTLDAPELAGQHIWRGTVVVAGRASVPVWPYLRAALALLRREASF